MRARALSTRGTALAGVVMLVSLILTRLDASLALTWLSLAWGGTALGLLVLASRIRQSEQLTRQLLRTVTQRSAPAQGASPSPAAPTRPAARTEPVDDRTSWSREETFGEHFTVRSVDDFVEAPPVDWVERNPFAGVPMSTLLDQVKAEVRWRYHHGVEAIPGTEDYYATYALRVDSLLEMVGTALRMAAVDPATSSFLDIGAAEGYVVNHLLGRGATDVDAVELSEGNIRRMWMVRALKGQDSGRIGRIDLDRADWSRALGRRYDVTLGLGVIYHLENPMLFARNLHAATDRVAVVESDTPVLLGNKRFRGFGNVYLHRDQVTLARGDVRHLTELRPDRQALAEMLLAAGFRTVDLVPAATVTPSRYFTSGEKTVMVARV